MKSKVFAFAMLAFVAMPSHAINAKYRQQLEKSGCTQVTEADGTCDIHLSKKENAERSQITSFVRDSVINQPTDAAYEALSGYGFTNPAPLKWVKGKYTINLTINQKDVVTNATVKP